jgi:hypothetical protein
VAEGAGPLPPSSGDKVVGIVSTMHVLSPSTSTSHLPEPWPHLWLLPPIPSKQGPELGKDGGADQLIDDLERLNSSSLLRMRPT